MNENSPRIRRGRYKGMESVEIVGPFDAGGPEAEEAVRQILEEGGTSIVFDLSRTTYLTSPGIALVIKAIKWFAAVNGSVYVTGATPDIEEFLALARIDRYVTCI